MGLKDGIWASRLGLEPQGWVLNLKTDLGPKSWDLGLKARIWALRRGGGERTNGGGGGGEISAYVKA